MEQEEAVKERLGSPIGHKIVKAKVKNSGIAIKADGTPMELLTVAAALIEEVMFSTGTPLHEVQYGIEELIMGQEETNTKGNNNG